MRQITSKAFWISAGKIGSKFFNFLTTIYLARILGTAHFGLVSIGLSVLGYAVWFSDMGLITIGTRETAKPRDKREFSPSALFWVRVGAGMVVFVFATLLVYVLPLPDSRQSVIFLFLISVLPNALLLEWYFNGLQEYRDVALNKMLKAFFYLILVYLGVNISSDVWWVPLFYLVGSIAGMAYLFIQLSHPQAIFSLDLSRHTAFAALKKSLTIGLGSSFNQVVQLLPPIVIGAILSTSEAGIYSAAMKVVLIGALFDQVFVNLFLPMFTSYWSKSPERAPEIIGRIFRIMLTAGIVLSVMFMISSDWLVHLLFGAEYQSSVFILKILSWFLAATFINSVFAFGLLAINQDRAYFRSTLRGGLLALLLIIGFTFLGAPYWTAIAVLLSEVFIMAFNYHAFQKHISFDFVKPILAAVTASMLSSGLFYYGFSLTFIIQLPIFASVCLLAHYSLGGIKYSDVTWLINILKR